MGAFVQNIPSGVHGLSSTQIYTCLNIITRIFYYNIIYLYRNAFCDLNTLLRLLLSVDMGGVALFRVR